MSRSAKPRDRVSRRLPGAPTWLGPAGRREWRRAIREMDEAGFLELPTDIPMLEGYCRLADTVAELERAGLREELEEHRAVMFQYAEDLGLTPESRQAIRRALKLHPLDPKETARRKALTAFIIRRVRQIGRAQRARERRAAKKGRPVA